jgi:hypothetical protein
MALKVSVNGQEYRVPLSVADITLRTHLAIVAEEQNMPTELRQIVEEKDEATRTLMSKRLKKTVYAKTFLPYYATIVATATGIPRETLLGSRKQEGMPVSMLEKWYWQIMSAYARFEYEPGRNTFEIEGQTWTLPAGYMEKATFGEFAEAAQYEDAVADVASGNWGAMPNVMAVLLRPEGEAFDPDTFDDIVEQRAEIMRGLTMDVAYQVSFFLLERNRASNLDSLIYTVARQLGTFRQASGN